MMENIEKYASIKGISRQDALQAFLQVVVLKNTNLEGVRLIGGTALVIGSGNPRFSEDLDLTGVLEPMKLGPNLAKSGRIIKDLLGAEVKVTPPKAGRNTWRITCKPNGERAVKLHIDTQPYRPLTHNPLMVEYPGISPFVFPSIDLDEVMADKLIAVAFRKNLSGRDIFDIWYHWLKGDISSRRYDFIRPYVVQKLRMRSLKGKDFVDNIKSRLKSGISKRLIDEWERYLPGGLKDRDLYEQIYSTVRNFVSKLTI